MQAARSADRSRERIVFSGHVQGVGFRYTARTLAQRFPVSGFVRNLSNGTVEMVVEGARHDVDDLLSAIAGHFGDHITHIDRQPCDSRLDVEGFEIRF